MPRKDLTLSEKIALLNKIKREAPNASHRTLEKVTGVPKSTISRFLKNEQKFREEWALRENEQGTSRRRKREGKEPKVEEALNQWFAKVTSSDERITGPMLKMKAEDLAKKLGREDFKATDGWLSRWKLRHEIKFKKVNGEKGSVDAENPEKWKCCKLPELLKKFRPDDIYNADETGLYYRAIPDGSLCYKQESKRAVDRITVLCCTNMSGNDRRKLLVIGNRIMPSCFIGLRMDCLPVLYEANKTARVTSEIFSRWLKEWDAELQRQSRKILLLIDNSAAHSHLDSLENIQVEFLPANASIPMNVGIIKNLKTLYRGRLVHYILDTVEENQSCLTEHGQKINILQAIQFVADSWREIKSSTIRNCFAHCGWNAEYSNPTENADERNSELQIVEKYEEFLPVDSNVEWYNEYDDETAEGIAVKCEETSENEDSDEYEEMKPVTHQDARKFIDGLRIYFMQIGSEGSPLSSLDACADFVHWQSMKNSQHTCF